MIKREFILSVLLVNTYVSLAQERTIDSYFNKDWVPTTASHAVYYRTIEEVNSKYYVRDYFADTDQLQMEGTCTQVKPRLVYDGYVKWYYKNGNLKREAAYQEGEPVGDDRSYFENGSLKYHQVHRGELIFYHQYNSEMGEPLLINGDGVIVTENDGSAERFKKTYIEIVDSVLTRAYSLLPPSDTVYLHAEHIADYEGGLPRFYQDLSNDLKGKYPRQARRMGIEGKIYIQFIVSETGSIQDAWILKGIGAGCDEIALKTFHKQTQWKPARHKGVPVKSTLVLPITFRLN